jgi:hypothetical protein
MVLRKNKIPGATFTICTACAKYDDETLIDMAQERIVWQWHRRRPVRFDQPDALLEAAARLTLRLTLRGDWVDTDPGNPDDPDSGEGLYRRIQVLMAAFVNSVDGKDTNPKYLLARFAGAVANQIAKVPSLRAAVEAYVASTPENDP